MAFDKLSKVYALYKRASSEGEKEAALNRLRVLLSAVKMTLEEYEAIHGEGLKKPHVYPYVGQFERDLIAQIYYMVTDGQLHCGRWFHGDGTFVEFEMTDTEKLDFDIHWYTLRNAFREECRTLLSVFINKNSIFPENIPDWAKDGKASNEDGSFVDQAQQKKEGEEETPPEDEPDVREHIETAGEFSRRSMKEQMKMMMFAQAIDRVRVRREIHRNGEEGGRG